jgi:hypothetical protein
MLNTKIFKEMVVERPNDKSVKFTALDLDLGEKVKVFLVMVSFFIISFIETSTKGFNRARTPTWNYSITR